MKPFWLNLVTSSATLILLVALALPARSVVLAAREEHTVEVAAESPWPRPARDPRRVFGVYVDPWQVDDWARSVGEAPQLVAKFEAFSSGRAIDPWLAQSARIGVRRLLVSWEPWRPVPASWGTALQARPQPGLTNIEIARGSQDRYMLRFARSLASFRGVVYLRFAHEMNGYWYPWSRGPRAYVYAWRRMVRVFEAAGASNVRFVWSVNPNLYEDVRTWRGGLRAYWPGRRYVDAVGSTMIDFGGVKSYPVARFVPRLRWLRAAFGKPVILTEVNTAYAGRVQWLHSLRAMLAELPWISVVTWSQLPSRGKVHQAGTGVLDWDVRSDPSSGSLLASIIRDGQRRTRGGCGAAC
ncbi:glycosyl hydrolase [Solirubrobacter ginsenosidimutans]|uniref:Glycosyl hydrolase n=1 Tax=Solirubrobacter ginsenosidimutans TaxID=490573 RepID=A0A9X3S3T8_9ACTN|nr:glycosyl hydrolase [Solirubrobacter ginsenosidimutans]MDA0159913.1 glycosyl hydrolase [Solirubrobacter ginsenosidimutans]